MRLGLLALSLFLSPLAHAQEAPPLDPAPPPPVAPVEPAPVEPTPVEPAPVEPAPAVEPAPIPVPEPPPPSGPTQTVGYDFGYDNGFFLQTPDRANRLRIRGLVQPRFELVAADPTVATWNAGFAIQRAQIELVGNVFTRALAFTLKTEFGRGEAFMKDAFMDARFAEGVLLRAGLWKRPFSRQFIGADFRLAFLDRAITDNAFRVGRDIGLALQADLDRNPAFEWSVGVWSGTSDRSRITGDVIIDPDLGVGSLENVKVSNVPRLFTPTFVARAGYNFGDVLGYSEIDLDGGGPRFGIAASVLEGVDIAGEGRGVTRAEVDAIFKMNFVTVTGAGFVSTAQTDVDSLAQDIDRVGGYVQGGVLLFDAWHPALRYSAVVSTLDDAIEHEMLANVTYLIFSQNVVVGAEAGSNVGPAGPDVRVRVQGTVQF